MEQSEIKRIIFDVLYEIGGEINDSINTGIDATSIDIDLREHIVDSIMFISFIVELENRLKVNLPDDLLSIDILISLCGLINMIEEVVNHKGEKNANESTCNSNS